MLMVSKDKPLNINLPSQERNYFNKTSTIMLIQINITRDKWKEVVTWR